jgi:hypothetical protein
MTVQEILNNATEGGYHIYGSDGMDTYYEGANSEYSVWTRKDNESSFLVPTEETFLDPHFWQALGRTLGWSVRDVISRSPVCMGRKSVSAVAATTGCINGIVLSRQLRMVIPLKPSLHVSPPRRHRGSRTHESHQCRPSVLCTTQRTRAEQTTTRGTVLVSVEELVRYEQGSRG